MRLFATLLLLAGLAVGFAPTASACSDGNYYDPMHQICAPYPPSNCPPIYWQACAYPAGLPPQQLPPIPPLGVGQ